MIFEAKISRRKAIATALTGTAVAVVTGSAGLITTGCQGATSENAPEVLTKKPITMKVGCQHGGTEKRNLEFLARHGVSNLDGGAPKVIEGKGWDFDDSLSKREACEKYGISLDAYHLPLTSVGIDKVATPNVMLGRSPERDREIEMIQ